MVQKVADQLLKYRGQGKRRKMELQEIGAFAHLIPTEKEAKNGQKFVELCRLKRGVFFLLWEERREDWRHKKYFGGRVKGQIFGEIRTKRNKLDRYATSGSRKRNFSRFKRQGMPNIQNVEANARIAKSRLFR